MIQPSNPKCIDYLGKHKGKILSNNCTDNCIILNPNKDCWYVHKKNVTYIQAIGFRGGYYTCRFHCDNMTGKQCRCSKVSPPKKKKP